MVAAINFALAAVGLLLTTMLHGCGDEVPCWDEEDGSCLWECASNLPRMSVNKANEKGICMDDTTFLDCPNQIPYRWPHTNTRITSMRLFSPWKAVAEWPESKRENAWSNLINFIKGNNARVLLGVEHTCDQARNDAEWATAKEFLRRIGRSHVMGVAIGNEMELLHMKEAKFTSPECQYRLWVQQEFLNTFKARVTELDQMGFDGTPVTTAIGGYAFSGGNDIFVNHDQAKIQDFLIDMVRSYGDRFVWTFNFYPYFEPNLGPDPNTNGRECEGAIAHAATFARETSNIAVLTKIARDKMWALYVTFGLPGDGNYPLWVGETGWSYPRSTTLSTNMVTCDDWHSKETFQSFYEQFLAWDLEVGLVKKPDHVFYFTIHDSVNFEKEEHFGLIGECGEVTCKVLAPWSPSSGSVSLVMCRWLALVALLAPLSLL